MLDYGQKRVEYIKTVMEIAVQAQRLSDWTLPCQVHEDIGDEQREVIEKCTKIAAKCVNEVMVELGLS